jgi:hypothetical protein
MKKHSKIRVGRERMTLIEKNIEAKSIGTISS